MSFIIKKRFLYFILLIYILILTFVFIILIIRVHSIKNTISNQPEYTILIEIDEKKLYLLEGGKLIKKYPIASGMKNLPSPIGTWKIIDKGE
ncbi:L,D-transpeptidase catalytic domain [Anaerocolumna jejuensis DSM 15929]|uniref:L,D-transpeptidase catalytic domain n=1 Tax=Anaerocolumna jejuensis DSM 15929 TaxID=1121322 RepID=A0A1M6JBM2_9FIRM|nr:L,D-transpeptidase catalytic domain [Anaerocolumna jejuensis DSM 15929]